MTCETDHRRADLCVVSSSGPAGTGREQSGPLGGARRGRRRRCVTKRGRLRRLLRRCPAPRLLRRPRPTCSARNSSRPATLPSTAIALRTLELDQIRQVVQLEAAVIAVLVVGASLALRIRHLSLPWF